MVAVNVVRQRIAQGHHLVVIIVVFTGLRRHKIRWQLAPQPSFCCFTRREKVVATALARTILQKADSLH